MRMGAGESTPGVPGGGRGRRVDFTGLVHSAANFAQTLFAVNADLGHSGHDFGSQTRSRDFISQRVGDAFRGAPGPSSRVRRFVL